MKTYRGESFEPRTAFIGDQSTEAEASLDSQVPAERENDGSADEIVVGSDGEEKIDDNDGIVDNAQSSKEDFDSSKGSVLVATSGLVLALLGMILKQINVNHNLLLKVLSFSLG